MTKTHKCIADIHYANTDRYTTPGFEAKCIKIMQFFWLAVRNLKIDGMA